MIVRRHTNVYANTKEIFSRQQIILENRRAHFAICSSLSAAFWRNDGPWHAYFIHFTWDYRRLGIY